MEFSPRASAQQPITVQTIISRSGARWNAPTSPETFFASYEPSPNSPQTENAAANLKASPGQPLTPIDRGSVIGKDNRRRVKNTRAFPYSAIVFLRISFPGGMYTECTGWVVSPRIVATAGHCIQDPGLGWAESANVYAGLDQEAALGSARAREFFTVVGWQESHLPEFDYGAIQLDSSLGDRVGWMGMAVLSSDALSALTVRVTGFPADKPAQTLWTDTGPLRRAAPLRVFYPIDTYAGQSGSPVYQAQPNRACLYCVVGVHGYGVGGDPGGLYNSGIRITQQVLDNYLFWRRLP